MRDYAGIAVHQEPDPTRRSSLATIDYFLRDMSRAIRRIENGQVPNGSGDLITDVVLSDIYWVLDGRPTNQVGFGGTSPSGTATLSSTQHATKGFVYFGEAQQTGYDETNERLGVNTPTPDAKLHILQNGTPSLSRIASGDNGTGGSGGSGYSEDDPVLGPTYIGGVLGPPAVTWWGIYTSSGGSVVPAFHTGWQNVATDDSYTSFIAADNPGAAVRTCDFLLSGAISSALTWSVNLRIADLFSTGIGTAAALTVNLTCSDLTKLAYTLPAGSGAGTLGGSVTGSWSTVTMPAGVVTGTGTTANSISFTLTGATSAYVSITYFSVTTGTGLSSEALQRWDYTTDYNELKYALDANSSTTLEFSGTPKLRIATSGLEFDIGTPAAGNIWSASDSEGTGAWVTLGSLLDDDLDAIAALTGTGLLARTADNTWALRTLQAPAAGLAISNPAGVAGDPAFSLADDLAGLEGLAANGIAVRTGTSTWTTRSIAVGTGLSIADAGGVAANPTISLDQDLIDLAGITRTRGDLIVGGASAWVDLAIGSANTFLKSDGTDPAWTSGAALTRTDDTNVTLTLGGSATTSLVNAASLTLGWTGQLALTRGGTGINAASVTDLFNQLDPLTTLGDILYRDGTNSVRLAGNTTTTRKFLRQTGDGVNSAAPAWDTLVAGDIPDLSATYQPLDADLTQIAAVANVRGDILITDSGPTWVRLAKGATAGMWLRSDGTDVAWSTTTIPNSATTGDVLYASGSNTYANLADVATGNALISGGVATAPSWGKIGLTTHVSGTLPVANGGTGQTTATAAFNALDPLTTLGDILYHNGTDSVRLAGNTTTNKRFLRQQGDGVNSAAPSWVWLEAENLIWLGTHNFNDRVQMVSGTAAPFTLLIGSPGETFWSLNDGGSSYLNLITDAAIGSGGDRSLAFPFVTGVVMAHNTALPLAGAIPYGAGASTVMTSLAIGASGTILTSTGSAPQWSTNASVVDSARTWATLQKFPDNLFNIVGSSDATKIAAFEVDGFTTGTTRTFTLPNASATLAGLSIANVFTTTQKIDMSSDLNGLVIELSSGHSTNAMEVNTNGGSGGDLAFIDSGGAIGAQGYYFPGPGGHIGQLLPAAVSTDPTWTLPNVAGTLCLIAATQNLSNKTLLTTGNTMRANTASSGVAFVDNSDFTKTLRMILSGAVGNNTFTLANTSARDYTFTNQSGAVATDANIVCYDNEVVCADDQVVLTY